MKLQRWLYVSAILGILLPLTLVTKSHGSALGLADGNYNIAIDFTHALAPDATGTIQIGAAGVTSFHLQTFAAFDCNGCAPSTSTPDLVNTNNGTSFQIADSGTGMNLTLNTGGTVSAIFTAGGTGGVWGATLIPAAVPEPGSGALLLFGISALGWRLRRNLISKQN